MKRRILSLALVCALAALPFSLHENGLSKRSIASLSDESPEITQGLYPRDLRVSGTFGRSGEVHLYFNLPPYNNPGGIGLIPALIGEINKAKVSIRMAIFQFNHPEVFSALKKAASERGVKIYLATDRCYSTKLGYKEYFDDLALALNASGQDANKQIVDDATESCGGDFNHNKYMIFDYERGEGATSWMGSFNPTSHGSVENVELAVTVKGSQVAEILRLDHDQLMAGITKVKKKGIYLVDGKPMALSDSELTALANSKAVIDYPKVTIADRSGDLSFEIMVAPKVKSIGRIVEELYDAKEEIVFSSFAISDPMLISTLINKHTIGSNTGYNAHPVAIMSHPWEKNGIVLRLSGEKTGSNARLLWEWSPKSKAPDPQALAALQPIAQDLKTSISSWNNYLVPSGQFKSAYRYFYPKGPSGGKITKVEVEGIFNSKVIGEESTLQRLKAANIPIYRSQMNGELHNKLFIVDEKIVIFGSHNFSQAAENSNDELTIIIKSPSLGKLLKDELYSKTKHFAVGPQPTINYSSASVAITEVMPSTPYKLKQKVKTIDMGEYVELYNYGTASVNLYAFRLDDRYFPAEKSLVPEITTNSGFSADLVGYEPPARVGETGKVIYNPAKTILRPGHYALVVGKYFHPSFYRDAFIKNFTAINKRAPTDAEFPLLLTVGAYYASVIGDATQGLNPRDKIALYGLDYYTLIDRFDYPADLHYIDQTPFKDYYSATTDGQSVERFTNNQILRTQLDNREFDHQKVAYRLKGATNDSLFEYRGDAGLYHSPDEWGIVPAQKGGSPGTSMPAPQGQMIPMKDRVPEILRDGRVSFIQDYPSKRYPASSLRYSLEGKIVDVDKNTTLKGVIVVNGDKIEAIYPMGKIPSDVPTPVLKDIIIYPGLIDAHNHIKYNNFPLWKTPKPAYNNRYDWQNEKTYGSGIKEMYKRIFTEQSHCEGMANESEKLKCQALAKCLVVRYGEIKGLAGGTTTIQGASSFEENTSDFTFKGITPYFIGPDKKRAISKARLAENAIDECLKGGGRNLERELWNGHDIVRVTSQPIKNDFWPGAAPKLLAEMNNKNLKGPFIEETHAFFIHLGEGQDQLSKDEWTQFENLSLGRTESIVIHGTAFGTNEFTKMAKAQMPLLWSPTSNLLLYKKTTDVVSAIRAGVVVALGSDWSLSGTKSLLGELKVADRYNTKFFKGALTRAQLLKMVTSDAARASHLDPYIGTLTPGKLADFLIFKDKKPSEAKFNPADFLVTAFDKDVYVTVVGGKGLYGEEYPVKELLNLSQHVNALSYVPAKICGEKTFVYALDYGDEYNSYEKLRDYLNPKTLDAFKSLTPAAQAALGDAFKELDPLCEYGDARFQKLIGEMEAQLAK